MDARGSRVEGSLRILLSVVLEDLGQVCHRVPQGAAQRGWRNFTSFCGSLGPFSCSKMRLLYLKTCTP